MGMEAVPPSRHGASARQTPGPLLQANPGPRLRADWQIINHTIGLTPHAIEVLKALPRRSPRVSDEFERNEEGLQLCPEEGGAHAFPLPRYAPRADFEPVRAGVGHSRSHGPNRATAIRKSVMRYTSLSGNCLTNELAKLG